jgi:hypothetical protein
MLRVCGELEAELMAGDARSGSKLGDMQAGWSQWLDAAEAAMGDMRVRLQQQQADIAALASAVQQHSAGVQVECQAYAQQQSQCSQQLQQEVSTLRQQMAKQNDQYVAASAQQSAEATLLLQQKAQALEHTVAALMADFLQASQGALHATLLAAQGHVSSLQSACHTGLTSIAGLDQHSLQLQTAHATRMVALTGAHATASEEALQSVQTLSGDVQALSAAQLVLIGNKRKLAEEDTRAVLDDLQAMTKKSCKQVQYTAQAANQVLSAVGDASSQMQASAEASLQEFTGYMDGEGEALQQSISTHFDETREVCIQQQEGLHAAQQQLAGHGQSMRDCTVEVTGSTPRKAKTTVQPALAPTRPHGLIKQEAKRNQAELSYEDALRVLQLCMQAGSEVTSEATSAHCSSAERSESEEMADKLVQEAEEVEVEVDVENMAPSNIQQTQRSSSRRKAIPSITTRARSSSNLKLEN